MICLASSSFLFFCVCLLVKLFRKVECAEEAIIVFFFSCRLGWEYRRKKKKKKVKNFFNFLQREIFGKLHNLNAISYTGRGRRSFGIKREKAKVNDTAVFLSKVAVRWCSGWGVHRTEARKKERERKKGIIRECSPDMI